MNSLENIVAPYTVSERMLCSLYDSLTDSKSMLEVSDGICLMRMAPSRQAQFTLFTSQFNNITASLKISQLANSKCFTFWQRPSDHNFTLVTCSKSEISLFQLQNQKGVSIFRQQSRVQLQLQGDDELVYLSKQVHNQDKVKYLVAYSKKDEFYLVKVQEGIKSNDVKIVSATKLQGQIQPKGWFNWLKKSKPQPHFQKIFIQTFIQRRYDNGFKVLSVRDHKIMLHNVYDQSNVLKATIKPSNQWLISEIVPFVASSTLYQVIFNKKNHKEIDQLQLLELLLIYQKNNQVSIVQTVIDLQLETLSASILISNIPSNNLSIVKFKQDLYMAYKSRDEMKQYKLNAFKLFRKNKQIKYQLKDQEPLYISNEPIILTTNAKELFIVSKNQIQKLASQILPDYQFNEPHLQFLHKLQKFYQTKISKCISNQDHEQILYLLQEKEKKIMDMVNLIDKDQQQIDSVKKEIVTEAICVNIVISIIQSQNLNQLNTILNYYCEEDPYRQEALKLALRDNNPKNIKKLLAYIIQHRLTDIFIQDILQSLARSYQSEQPYCSIISELCSQFVKICFNLLTTSNTYSQSQNQRLYKLLVNYSIPFMKLENKILYDLFGKMGEQKMVKDLILNHNLSHLFIIFLMQRKIKFSIQEMNEIVKNHYNQGKESLKAFTRSFFKACRKIQKIDKDFVANHIEFIIHGFEGEYLQIVMPQISQIYPGLQFYFYLNAKARKQGADALINLSENVKNPTVSYLSRLSVSDYERNQHDISLATLRMCRDLNIDVKNAYQICEEMKKQNYEQIVVGRQNWDEFKAEVKGKVKDFMLIEKKIVIDSNIDSSSN